MNFDKSWEEKIYSRGKQVNRYPFGDLVSFFYQALAFLEERPVDRNNIKVLDLGCGAGNNLFFLAREGYDAYGIDGSKSACKIAKKFLKKEGLVAKITDGSFSDLPYEDELFDVVIDRESTYCGAFEERVLWWNNIYKKIKPGGVFLSFSFSVDNPFYKLAREQNIATKLDEFTYKDFNYGTFMNTGVVNFLDENRMNQLFKQFDIIKSYKHLLEPLNTSPDETYVGYGEYIIIGVKK
jgi:SAM-dependent methyltransferase